MLQNKAFWGIKSLNIAILYPKKHQKKPQKVLFFHSKNAKKRLKSVNFTLYLAPFSAFLSHKINKVRQPGLIHLYKF